MDFVLSSSKVSSQGEVKNRRKRRSRRDDETEVFFAAKIRLLTSAVIILEYIPVLKFPFWHCSSQRVTL